MNFGEVRRTARSVGDVSDPVLRQKLLFFLDKMYAEGGTNCKPNEAADKIIGDMLPKMLDEYKKNEAAIQNILSSEPNPVILTPNSESVVYKYSM